MRLQRYGKHFRLRHSECIKKQKEPAFLLINEDFKHLCAKYTRFILFSHFIVVTLQPQTELNVTAL